MPLKCAQSSVYSSKTSVTLGLVFMFLTFFASASDPKYSLSRLNSGQTGTQWTRPFPSEVATRATRNGSTNPFSTLVHLMIFL